MVKYNIIGYFVCKLEKDETITPANIFVAIDEISDSKGNITAYAPIGQHGALSREYLKECKEITKEEYIKFSKGIYTPEEYLI